MAKDMNNIKLLEDNGSQAVQMIRLKAIEETPFNLPHTQR